MRISLKDLDAAVKEKLISQEQADILVKFWEKDKEDVASFKLTHVLYYFGGLLTISAISLFVTQAWDQLLGFPLFVISSLFIVLGLLLMRYFLNQQLRLPAGIMATFSLVAVPLAIYNLQSWLGYLPNTNFNYANYNYYISWSWIYMELGTLLVGAIMFYLYRFPFLLFPISITLWYLSMDLYAFLYHVQDYDWQERAIFSMYFGLIMLLYAVFVDIRHSDDKEDYAFWLYLFGVIAFWSGLSSQYSSSELSHVFYCLINIFMVLLSVFLNRRVFAVFGAAGILMYLSHLAFRVFAHSLGFPIVLVFLGILIILVGTRWAKLEKQVFNYLKPYIPPALLSRRER